MEKLPHEILENILFRLPSKPALEARRVCKTWTHLLSRHNGLLFVFRLGNKGTQLYYGEQYDRIYVGKMNYYYSYKELIKLNHGMDLYKDGMCTLVGSCNGLVCLKIHNQGAIDSFLICNPLIGEVVVLPSSRLLFDAPSPAMIAYGFGYCRSANNYKVVRIYYSRKKVAEFQVCTIGSGWRNLVSITNKVCSSAGIFVNGALHWLDYDDKEYTIVAFDVEDEEVRWLPKPPSESPYCVSSDSLVLLGANLCLVQKNLVDLVDRRINIWAYKKINSTASYEIKRHDQKSDYYNKKYWNWIKVFSIKVDEYCWEPFAITRNNEVLLWRRNRILYCYHPKTSTLKKLWDKDNGMGCSQAVAIPHTISLISLKDLVENAAGDYKYSKTGEAVTLY